MSSAETFHFDWAATPSATSATVKADNNFQVYQGSLPPLGVPTGFKGTSRPAAPAAPS